MPYAPILAQAPSFDAGATADGRPADAASVAEMTARPANVPRLNRLMSNLPAEV